MDNGNTKQHKGGRPSTYTQELADLICEELALGKSMRSVCTEESMPAMSTVFKWLREIKEFSEQYEKAKQEATDAMAEDLLHIADTPVLGEIKTTKPDGTVEIKQDEMLGHRRLQIDTRKWLMAKMKPKKYGEKLDVTTDGKALPTPIMGGSSVRKDDSLQQNSGS